MVSDYFFPNAGGVESHIYHLSQCLIKMGHSVVIVTHSYGERKGVRYMTNGLKVYYLPMVTIFSNASLPSILTTLPICRKIFIREQIELVHAHSAFSALGNEAILHATLLKIPSVFTDHSLYGFGEIDSIIVNKVLKFFLSLTKHLICVSHTSKENTVLRTGIQPQYVSVIPNAVNSDQFIPDYDRFNRMHLQKGNQIIDTNSNISNNILSRAKKEQREITIVVISRLVYRKGVDLLVAAIPKICQQFSYVKFIIGGSGNKELLLQEMIEKNNLFDRVEMVGALKHSMVREYLIRGDIFLNTSLTEAFCIAIIEAASCGLLVVSTAVGGVPEVLPSDIVILCDTSVNGLIRGVETALQRVDSIDPAYFHEFVKSSYSWFDVARRTELVYTNVLSKTSNWSQLGLIQHVSLSIGPFLGLIAYLFLPFCFILISLLDYYSPREDIDIALPYPTVYHSQCNTNGHYNKHNELKHK